MLTHFVRQARVKYVLFFAVTASVVVSAVYLTWVYRSATALDEAVDTLDSPGELIKSDDRSAALASLEVEVAQISDDLDRLDTRVAPIRVVSSFTGWVPWVGDQFTSIDLLVDRAKHDVAAVGPLLEAADGLISLQEEITDSNLDIDQKLALLSEESRLEEIANAASEAAAELELAQSRKEKADKLSLMGTIDSRAVRLASKEEEIVGALRVVEAAVPAIRSLSDLADESIAFADLFAGSDLETDLERIETVTNELLVVSGGAVETSAALVESIDGTFSGSLEDFSRDLHSMTVGVDSLAQGLSDLLNGIGPGLETVSESETPLLSDGETLIAALGDIEDHRDQVEGAFTQLSEGRSTLEGLKNSDTQIPIPGQLDSALEIVDQLVMSANFFIYAPAVGRSMVDSDRPMKYLVLGQSSDELRAAGGFTSSVWLLTFESGSLSDREFTPILEFDDLEQLGLLPEPPNALRTHMAAGASYLRDVGWSPDFRDVAELAAEIHYAAKQEQIDGVISLTQWAAVDLITALGGIQVEGQFLPPEEVLEIIENRTDEDGTGFLNVLLDGLIESLRFGDGGQSALNVIETSDRLLLSKDIMIWLADPTSQLEVQRAGWGGAITPPVHDRVMIVDSNVGWSKADRNIIRSASYQIDLTDRSNPVARLELGYEHIGTGPGRSCSIQKAPSGGLEINNYEVGKNSCYWNYFRVYPTSGTALRVFPILPIPAGSVAVRTGAAIAGSNSFGEDFDTAGEHYRGLIALEKSERVDLAFEYSLPSTVVQQSEGISVYRLEVLSQPGTIGRQISFLLELPEGAELLSTNLEDYELNDGFLSLEFDLTEDRLIEVSFTTS